MSWKKVKLAEVIHKPISGEWGDEGDEVFVLRTTNFSNDGSLDLSDVVKRNIALSKVESKRLLPGDTILEKSGGSPSQPVGRVVYFDINNGEKYLCNNFTSVLRPKSGVYPKYLFWFLFYNHITKNTLRYQNKTTGILNLKTDRYINELSIPLPSISTQQKIAAILDTADSLRRMDKLLLYKYDELLQSIFYKMFGDPVKNDKGWPASHLKQSFLSGLKLGTIKPVTADGQTLIVRVGELGGLEIPIEKCKRVSLPLTEKQRYLLQENDILLARAIGSIDHLGKASLIKDIKQEMIFDSHVMRLQFDQSKVNSSFFYYWLQSSGGRKTFLKNAGKTSVQFNINAEQIARIEINLPPIKLQNDFAKLAEKVYEQKKTVYSQVTKTKNLVHTLLLKAFKGELIG